MVTELNDHRADEIPNEISPGSGGGGPRVSKISSTVTPAVRACGFLSFSRSGIIFFLVFNAATGLIRILGFPTRDFVLGVQLYFRKVALFDSQKSASACME